MVKQHPVVPPRGRLEVGRRRVPPLRPLTQADLAGGRVHVGAAQLGVLDANQEPLGIHLAGEAPGPLPPRRVPVARPPPGPASALLLAPKILHIAHRLPPFTDRPEPS